MKALFKIKKHFEYKYIQEMALPITFWFISILFLLSIFVSSRNTRDGAEFLIFNIFVLPLFVFFTILIGIYYRLLKKYLFYFSSVLF